MPTGYSSGAGSWVEIELSRIRQNYRSLREKINPSTKIMAVVKGDAYGHGLLPIARELVSLGTPALAVSSIDEGILIRKRVS
jgi:alanine racemase